MDISAFRERPASGTMTVSELNSFIKNIFDSNRQLTSVTVSGEISNFKLHSSGHLYFSLKDSGGQIRAVMFRSSAVSLRFMPENGMKVIVHGAVSVYTRDGSYQLYASTMQPDGVGALYLAYEQLKQKLEAEGLFDVSRKREIPVLPSKIGVITSPTGAAVRDIINVIGRRYPVATVYLYPALVQGDGAEESLIDALDYLDRSGLVDTIIIGRGGGSIEDLWAFNSERLARRIYASATPVISAVGHETDFTICDFVADLRAPTPSAAAELAVPDVRELYLRISAAKDRCDFALLGRVERARERMEAIKERTSVSNPGSWIDSRREQLVAALDGVLLGYRDGVRKKRSDFAEITAKVEAMSPLSVLSRGYAVATNGARTLSSVDDLRIGDDVLVRLSRGSFLASVKEIKK